MPLIIHIASSLSSVIYPAATRHGPPPGIVMHLSIISSEAKFGLNSLKEPQESPTNAPTIQPNARSSKVFGFIRFSISWFGSSLFTTYDFVIRILSSTSLLSGIDCDYLYLAKVIIVSPPFPLSGFKLGLKES